MCLCPKSILKKKKGNEIVPQEKWQNHSQNTSRDAFIARSMKVHSMCLRFVNAADNVAFCVSHDCYESCDCLAVDLKVLSLVPIVLFNLA